jgi:putative ABC transport system permease protein
MIVLCGFAVAALLLAGVGLYGTLSYLMSQRTQELGVRIALGASAVRVIRLAAYEGGVLAWAAPSHWWARSAFRARCAPCSMA